MEPIRTVVVLDGHVFVDETFHSVIDGAGEWRIGVQLAPGHTPPEWPDGAPQQVHVDLHVDDPAVHPFCIGWGHPSREALAAFVRERFG